MHLTAFNKTELLFAVDFEKVHGVIADNRFHYYWPAYT